MNIRRSADRIGSHWYADWPTTIRGDRLYWDKYVTQSQEDL
jgi:hypothetical protein